MNDLITSTAAAANIDGASTTDVFINNNEPKQFTTGQKVAIVAGAVVGAAAISTICCYAYNKHLEKKRYRLATGQLNFMDRMLMPMNQQMMYQQSMMPQQIQQPEEVEDQQPQNQGVNVQPMAIPYQQAAPQPMYNYPMYGGGSGYQFQMMPNGQSMWAPIQPVGPGYASPINTAVQDEDKKTTKK